MLFSRNRNIRNYFSGGQVIVSNANKWESQNRDTIPAYLEDGSLVIPRKHAKLVSSFIKSKGWKYPLPSRDRLMNTMNTVNAVLVKDELVIPVPYVSETIQFLKKNHIKLPGI